MCKCVASQMLSSWQISRLINVLNFQKLQFSVRALCNLPKEFFFLSPILKKLPGNWKWKRRNLFSFGSYELRIQNLQATLTKPTKTPAEIHKKALKWTDGELKLGCFWRFWTKRQGSKHVYLCLHWMGVHVILMTSVALNDWAWKGFVFK